MVFFNSCNITDKVYRERVGGRRVGWALGVGGKLKAGDAIHNETDSSNMFSVEHRSRNSQPGRPRRLLAAV